MVATPASERLSLVDALVFDLDGTIVDTLPDLAAALSDVLASAGLARCSVATARPWVGDGARALVRRALLASDVDPTDAALDDWTARFRGAYRTRIADGSRTYDGVVEVLDAAAAAGMHLAVCTNKPALHTELLLDALGLRRRFGAVVAGDTLATRKPDPAPVRAAAGARRALVIGDGAADDEAAWAAGMPFVWAGWGYGPQPGPGRALAEVTRSAELLRTLRALGLRV